MVNELNLEPQTEVKIKNFDVEVLKGKLSEKPWLIDSNNENYVLLEENQYSDVVKFLKKVLAENIELKMEQRIMAEFPIDYDDVKIVVSKKIEDENISIDKALKDLKKQCPNLFHKIEIENILEEFLI